MADVSTGSDAWYQGYFQTLFSQRQAMHYFAVILSDAIPREESTYISPHANAPHNEESALPAPLPAAWGRNNSLNLTARGPKGRDVASMRGG
ncbi:hypothetical protein N7471_010601 [Penicillium samsonianum]|uniref:uncharacterized protein n=1 Tax=Penicillium samsonianum TaxID=1882272 RepID=UPI00254880D8|nr:uncharacterized protein N7471_010601 [Penicillium samsonianum]KAJ6126108.1 hypothetical protein N7471_010601 [Penicillium samsonianum]